MDIRGQTTWRGGTVSGGGDLHLRAASIVSDGELKMWARVVNHGGMLLEDGQIIADTEGYLENRGTVEMVGPRTTYNGVTARRPRSETEVTLLPRLGGQHAPRGAASRGRRRRLGAGEHAGGVVGGL